MVAKIKHWTFKSDYIASAFPSLESNDGPQTWEIVYGW